MNKSDLTLADCAAFLWRKKREWCYSVFGITAAVALVSLTIVPSYKATAVVLPITSGRGFGEFTMPGGTGMALSAGLSSLLGGSVSPTGNMPKFLAILRSRAAARSAIVQNGLERVFFASFWDSEARVWKNLDRKPTLENAVDKLMAKMWIEPNLKTGAIEIAATMPDPQLAVDVVSSYVKYLKETIDVKAFTIARQQREFLGDLLLRNRKELLESSTMLSDFYRRFQVSANNAFLDVQLKLGEVPPRALNDLLRQKAESEKRLEKTMTVRNVPQSIYFDYLSEHLKLLREINGVLSVQYENAKVEEVRESLTFQVVDPPVPNLAKTNFGPKIITMLGFAGALLVSTFLVILLGLIERDRKGVA